MGNQIQKAKYPEYPNSDHYSFKENIIKDIYNTNVFKYYKVVDALGSGSMGVVSCVHLRRSALLKKSAAYNRSPISFNFMRFMDRLSFNKWSLIEKRRPASKDFYALKTVQDGKRSAIYLDELRNEIDILKTLDHPNIVKAYEVFNYKRGLFVVMELCSGGDLYSRTPYTEEQAATIVKKIVSAVNCMHKNGVVHLDLKFENILFENSSPNAEIKLIDFGLSKKIRSNQIMTERVGTVYSMAPEVIKRHYTAQADMWSVGVISYMLLANSMPFHHRKRNVVIEKILNSHYNFNAKIWDTVSDEAMDFIASLLMLDPQKRRTPKEALSSPWLLGKFSSLDKELSIEEMQQINYSFLKYCDSISLKKIAMMIIAHKSTTTEIVHLRKVFDFYNSSGNGYIELSEFKSAMSNFYYSDKKLEEIFQSIDLDRNGIISFTEFLAATFEAKGRLEEEKVADTFHSLDIDKTGFISGANLQAILGKDSSPEKVAELIREGDENNDGKISYQEFLKLFKHDKIKERLSVNEETSEETFVDDDINQLRKKKKSFRTGRRQRRRTPVWITID